MIGYNTVGSQPVGDSGTNQPQSAQPTTSYADTSATTNGNSSVSATTLTIAFVSGKASGGAIVFANSGIASSGITVNTKIDVALIDTTPSIALLPGPEISLIGI